MDSYYTDQYSMDPYVMDFYGMDSGYEKEEDLDEYDKLQKELDSYARGLEPEEPEELEIVLDEYAIKTIEADMEKGIEIDDEYVEGFEDGFQQGAEDFKHDIEVEEEEKEWRQSFCYGDNCIYVNDNAYDYVADCM